MAYVIIVRRDSRLTQRRPPLAKSFGRELDCKRVGERKPDWLVSADFKKAGDAFSPPQPTIVHFHPPPRSPPISSAMCSANAVERTCMPRR